jgi:hypothetical protein
MLCASLALSLRGRDNRDGRAGRALRQAARLNLARSQARAEALTRPRTHSPIALASNARRAIRQSVASASALIFGKLADLLPVFDTFLGKGSQPADDAARRVRRHWPPPSAGLWLGRPSYAAFRSSSREQRESPLSTAGGRDVTAMVNCSRVICQRPFAALSRNFISRRSTGSSASEQQRTRDGGGKTHSSHRQIAVAARRPYSASPRQQLQMIAHE